MHSPQLNSSRFIFCVLLAFVYPKYVIPGFQEAITTDLKALGQVTAIPGTPSSTSELRNVAHPTYVPHFNDHRAYLLQPSLWLTTGYYGYIYPGDSSNHHSAKTSSLPSNPMMPVPPRISDGSRGNSRRILTNGKFFDTRSGPSKDSSSMTSVGSQMIIGHQASTQKSFDPELTQRMLNCEPFTPGPRQIKSQKEGKDFQVRTRIQNQADIETNPNGIDLHLHPVRTSGNPLGYQADQSRDPVDELAKHSASKVPCRTKESTGILSSSNDYLETNPDDLMNVKNFIKTFGCVIPSAVVDDKRPGSNGPHGSDEFLQENSKVGKFNDNAELDEAPTSSHTDPLSSPVSNVISKQSPRVEPPDDPNWIVKNPEQAQPPEKPESLPSRGHEIEYPRLTSTSEESNAAQRGKSSHLSQEGSNTEGAAPDYKTKKKQENPHEKSAQTFPLAKSHGSSEKINSPRSSQFTVSFTSKQKGDKAKGSPSPSQRPSQFPGQTKVKGTDYLQPSQNILDQKDPQVKAKTLSLLGIEQPKNTDPAPQSTIQSGTPRNNKKLHASTDQLSQQAKTEFFTKTNDGHKRHKIEADAKASSIRLTKPILKTGRFSVRKSLENLEKIQIKGKLNIGDVGTEASTTATKKSLLPQDYAQEFKHHSKASTDTDTILATNNEHLSNLFESPLSTFAQPTNSNPKIGILPSQENQVHHSPTNSQESLQLKISTLKECVQDPIKDPGSIEILTSQAIKTIQKQLDQPTSGRKEETHPTIKETVKGSSKSGDNSQHPGRLECYHISIPNPIPTQSNPSSNTKFKSVPISQHSNGFDDQSPTQISRQILSLTPKNIKPLNKITPQIETLKDTGLEASSWSMASGNHKAHASSKLLQSPPSFMTDDQNRKINYKAIISLEAAFGESIQSKNPETCQTTTKRKSGVHLVPMLPLRGYLHVENCSNHVPVGFITNDEYQNLLSLWRKDSNAYQKVESGISNELGAFEAARRINALRRQIVSHRISRKWSRVRGAWFGYNINNPTAAIGTENLLGLSIEPKDFRDIPISSTLARSRKQMWGSKPELGMLWGQAEMERQFEMRSYLAQRTNPFFWWEDYDLNMESKLFGLDITTILKVGDSLQFGTKFLVSRGYGRLSIDSAYALLLDVMTDTKRPLPWIESSERAWFYRLSDGLYERRLRRLSQLISNRNPQKNPFSAEILAQKMDGNYLSSARGYRMGEELLWVDQGRPLDELLENMKNRNPAVSDPMLDLPEPEQYPTWEEFKDILATSAHYFWLSFKNIFG
ncbi:hypothetical protein PTTG_26305 [Puccinia triticina 1-1 BBBD Race 1]|uniref:Uncharacterized protein n=2 Tax=Puccinia triticina TaxID=208348 RepID=A0A180GUL9_PUCT1|nr:hypothetical protein PTTG_26305 [Puccinia triticina 1-1 BBBD Race 1]WAR54145.1 hypothetical protein PtB15_3B657 [Puccinia triticina]